MPLDPDKPMKKKRPPPRRTRVEGRPEKSREMMSLEEKLLDPDIVKAREALKAKFGDRALSGFDKPMPKKEVIHTGFRDLDLRCIGGGKFMGGWPRGQFSEVFGKESGGKSTFVMGAIANAQRNEDAHCVFIDLERTTDDGYARAMGIDTDKWDYCIPADGDEAVEMFLLWVKAGADMIVLDSVGAIDTKEDIDRPLEDSVRVAGPIHLIKKLLMKAAKPMFDHNTVGILINQVRAVMNPKPWQKKIKTTGGHRLAHAFALRLEVTGGSKMRQGNNITGREVIVTVEKNKIGPPLGKTNLPMVFGEGIAREAFILEEAIRIGIVQKRGAYLKFAGDIIGQGKDKARVALKQDPELLARIEREITGKDEEEDTDTVADPSGEDTDEYNIDQDAEVDLE